MCLQNRAVYQKGLSFGHGHEWDLVDDGFMFECRISALIFLMWIQRGRNLVSDGG